MEPWYEALCILADHQPAAFWEMTYGATFWWTPGRSQLAPDGFTEQPFTYAEIGSVTVFDRVPVGAGDVVGDWELLRRQLAGVWGLKVEESRDVSLPPAIPPNHALRLTRAEPTDSDRPSLPIDVQQRVRPM